MIISSLLSFRSSQRKARMLDIIIADRQIRICQWELYNGKVKINEKKEYSAIPESMRTMETYGFSWMDFVTAIPSPLFVVTSYKSNGKLRLVCNRGRVLMVVLVAFTQFSQM